MSYLNPWQQWRGLQPAPRTLWARVIELHPDGTATVELPGGDRFRARGHGVAMNAAAFVRGGEVIGPAPEVVPMTLEV